MSSAAFLPPAPLLIPRKTALQRARPRTSERKPPRTIFATATPAPDSSPETPEPAPDDTIDVETRAVPLQSLKSELFLLLSSSSRGFSSSSSQKSQILSTINSLESQNPTPGTSYSPFLPGKWRLLYTTARDVLSLSLLSPVANTGQVYQNITPNGTELDVENLVYFQPPFHPLFDVGTEALLKVRARGVVTGDDRIDLTFMSARLSQTSLVGVTIPDKFGLEVPLRSPVGYLDTTYLDEDIRIGRAPMIGSNENIFVLAREE